MTPDEPNANADQPGQIVIRLYKSSDNEAIERLTLEGFVGVSVDYLIEKHWPGVSGLTWGERKWLGTGRDVAEHPEWCFVAELAGEVLGYVTTTMSDLTRQGRIGDLAVDARWRGQGIGRRLILHALDVFRRHGMTIARIETLSGNPIGSHLYPTVGFELVTTQNHYAMRLDRSSGGDSTTP